MNELRIRDEEKIKIIGMHCATCVNTVSKALSSVNGVEVIAVNLSSGDARIRLVKPVKLKDVVNAVRKAGYDVALEKAIISISINPEDVNKVSEKIESISGVIEAKGNPNGLFKIYYNPLSVSLDKILEEIKRAGYNPKVVEKELKIKEVVEREFKSSILKLTIAVIFSIATLLFQYYSLPILSFLASIPVMSYSGSRFYLGAIRALKNKTTNMDVLVFLSSYITWIFSIIMLTQNAPTIFDAPVLLITFVLAGKTLESYLRFRLLSNIISSPISNIKARKENNEEVDADSLKVGDIVIVKAGEIIPCDGIVEDGEGEVNESLLTGESVPIRKVKGDAVLGGSTLVSGYLKIYATRTSENTYISQVTKTVNEASTVKLNYQRIVDKVSSIFVPVIIGISVVIFAVWYLVLKFPLLQSLLFSISVLAVACPCALGLATPMAISSTINKALKKGIVIRRGEVLEALKEVKVFIFDKTGTVTENRIMVEKYKEFINDAVEIASAVESLSPHPIAKAIAYLHESNGKYRVEGFDEFPGYGVSATVNGMKVAIGRPDFVKNNCNWNIEEEEGDVFMCINNSPAAVFWLKDPIKEEALRVINALSSKGYRVVIATGSSKGIEGVESYTLLAPDDKVDLVRKFKAEGYKVAFIGDGINDANALMEADVGIAISSGSEITKMAGDVIIKDVTRVLDLMKISDTAISKVKQNLAWAFSYNSILVPIAAGILYPHFYLPPEYSALAMSLSSVVVTLWSFI